MFVHWLSKKIYHINNNDHTLYCSFKEDIIFFSRSKRLIEDVLKEIPTNENLLTNQDFNQTYNTISKTANINLFINYNSLLKLINIYSKIPAKIQDLSEWASTDIKIRDNVIIASGFGKLNPVVKNYSDILAGQSPQNVQITKMIPQNTSLLISLGFNKNTLLLKKKK